MKRIHLFLAAALFFLTSHVHAQTWGCPEQDYKCQLDGRMKALQADPKDPENYYNIGIVFQRSKAHAQAIESFSMYIAIPGVKAEYLADGYNNRGISQRAIKRPDLAIADYNKAIELNPKKPDYLVNRGNANADLRKLDEALADYGRAITLDAKYAPAYAQRGILHATRKSIDEALHDYSKSIDLDPLYAEPYYNRGVIYSARKEFARAIPDYERYVVLITDPVYLADGYMNLGIAHFYSGSPQKAVDAFTKVIEVQPKFANGYKARAMVYREMKKDKLADADEKKAAELGNK